MFKFFRRKTERFNLGSIGNDWIARPLTHDNVAGELKIRQLPKDIRHDVFKFVCLAQCEKLLNPAERSALTHEVQTALEHDGHCLMVLTHEIPERITWYAYSATEAALDLAFSSLGDPSVLWGINEDASWLEYENARQLVGV